MLKSDLRKFIRQVVTEALLPTDNPSYKWNPDKKTVEDSNGKTLNNPNGEPITFTSQGEVQEYLEANNIKATVQEMTGTGAVAGYATPYAFSGPGDKQKKDKIAADSMPGGKVVKDIYEEDNRRTLEEGRYHNFKNHPDMKNEAKVSYLMAEVHKMLKEVDFLVSMSTRLKEDTGAAPKWKRTPKDIASIYGKIKEISEKIKNVTSPKKTAPKVQPVPPVPKTPPAVKKPKK